MAIPTPEAGAFNRKKQEPENTQNVHRVADIRESTFKFGPVTVSRVSIDEKLKFSDGQEEVSLRDRLVRHYTKPALPNNLSNGRKRGRSP